MGSVPSQDRRRGYVVKLNPESSVQQSSRNGDVAESNKGGRTIPTKFSLRIAAAVDPNQPFVYNEELIVIIYKKERPENVLQESTHGTTATD